MSHSVRRHLHLEVDEYDRTIRRFIPGYEAMLGVAAEAVSRVRPGLVTELGAGTGGLSEALLLREEVGIVEVLDVDPEMLDRARQRLGRFGDRARFVLGSYDEPFSSCDAFAASLSLHHIPTIERKTDLFERAFDVLRPGGVFVNADANMPADQSERAQIYRYWADHLVSSGIDEERAWKHFSEWADEDTYLPLEAELSSLHSVGFVAERVWSDGPVGVVVATKPVSSS